MQPSLASGSKANGQDGARVVSKTQLGFQVSSNKEQEVLGINEANSAFGFQV